MAYLKAHRGDTEHYDMTLVDAAGAALDLDDLDEIWFSMKGSYAGSAVIEKTLTAGGITVTTPATGEARVTLAPDDTDDLDPGQYLFDVQVKDTATGDIYTPIRGRIKVSADVTRAII